MIKILLADDNKISLQYFSKIINWNQYGFQIVSEAIDGEEAFKDFIKFKPELVITDIDMPVMSGVDLATKINEIAPDTLIIFLSSYSEFSYVRSALKLKVFDYILKHELEKDVLIKKLEQIKIQIDKNKTRNKYFLEGALSSLFSDFEHYKPFKYEKYAELFPNKYDFIVLVHNHIIPPISEKLNLYTKELPENEVKKICYEFSDDILVNIKIAKYYYFLLSASSDNCYESIDSLKIMLEERFEQTFSCIIVSEKSAFKKGIQDYYLMKSKLDRIYFYPVSTIIQSSALQNTLPHMEDNLNALKEALKNNEINKILASIDKYYLKSIQFKDYIYFNDITGLLLSRLLEFHMRIKDISTGSFFIAYDDTSDLFWKDAISVFQWIKPRYLYLKDINTKNTMPKYSKLTNNIITFINDNLDDIGLNTETIAKHFELNINQLNYMLKKETGFTVLAIITNLRMSAAKRLIEQNKYKIMEICGMTGYATLSYFSKVFKKTYGIPPQDYRRKKIIENE